MDGLGGISPAALERELREALMGHRLAGEVRVSETDLETLEQQACNLVVSGVSDRGLTLSYPSLLVIYLTNVGVYRYEAGTYWPHVLLGELIPHNVLGAAFKRAVARLGLESFDDLVYGESAAQYVARIIAHGGIPRYCLGDYFSAVHAGLRHTDDLLSLWRTRRERLAHLDKPVGRFVRYGGAVAVDLVTRSVDLVHETAARGRVPAPEEAGLPAYFVEEYSRWRRRPDGAPPAPRGVPVTRPRVEIDPWSTGGPHLVIPPLHSTDGFWRVAGERGPARSVRVNDLHEQIVPLTPSRAWEVTLEAASGPERLFTFEAYGDLPALFFEPSRAVLVRDPLNLQLDHVMCLWPDGATVEVLEDAGEAGAAPRVIETFPSPTGDWHGYKFALLDLESVTRLRISLDGIVRVVRVSAPALRPMLEGEVVPDVMTEDGLPVYPRVPRIRIPDDLSAARWSLRIRRGTGEVTSSTVTAGSDGFVDVGPDAFGRLDIRLAGPLGSDLHEECAVVPGLGVDFPTRLLLPGDLGESICVSVDEGLVVNGLTSRENVPVPDDRDLVEFQVDRDQSTVPLQAHVPRLVWGFVGDGGIGAGLAAEKVRVDAADIEAGRVRALMIRTGRSGLDLVLQLKARSGAVQQRDAVETQGDGRWTFDLRPFQDAVHDSDEPVLQLELLAGMRSVHAADVVARYTVENITATSRSVEAFTEVAVAFDETNRLNSRVGRLWSLDRPWEDAVEQPLADGQPPPILFRENDRLPPGPYLAEIAVDDGWSKRARPLLRAENVCRIFVGDRQEWRSHVEHLDQGDVLQALEAVVADGHVTDETLDDLDFGPVAPEALAAFVWQLGHVPRGEFLPGPTNALRKALLDTLVDSFRAIAGAEERGVSKEALRRVELLCLRRLDSHLDLVVEAGLALGEDDFRALWRAAPAIAATVDLALTGNSKEAVERLSQQLTGGEPPVDGETAVVDPGGFRVDPQLLDRPADLLRGIADALEAYPGPPLTRRSLEAAYLEFLMAASDGSRDRNGSPPSSWFERHQELLRLLMAFPDYRMALEERLPAAGVMAWAGLPALVLAAAIHVRRQTARWQRATKALDEALGFAPSLVQHDLIAASLLIDRLRREGKPC